MADVELAEALITAAMAKADRCVCVGSERCYAFPDRLEDVRETCTPKGRCKIGWMVSRGGRESHDVWLEVGTGLVRPNRQADVSIGLPCPGDSLYCCVLTHARHALCFAHLRP